MQSPTLFNTHALSRLLRRSLVTVFFTVPFACLTVSGQTVTVVGWNVKSGGSDVQTIRQRMATKD